jgi:hypothetical protein
MVGGRSDFLDVVAKSERLVVSSRKIGFVKAVFISFTLPVLVACMLSSTASVRLFLLLCGNGSLLTSLSELLLFASKHALLMVNKRKVCHLELEDSWIAHHEGVCA